MPDESAPRPGWWKASDGNWYPPQPAQPAARTSAALGCLKAGLIVAAIFVAVIGFLVFVIAFLGAPAEKREGPDEGFRVRLERAAEAPLAAHAQWGRPR